MRSQIVSAQVLTAWLVLTFASSAVAQTNRSIDVERFRPALDPNGFIGFQGTIMPGHGLVDTQLVLNYSHDALVLTPRGEDVSVIEHRVGANLTAQVGLGGRGALALDVPFIMLQRGDDSVLADSAGPVESNAMGDPRIIARVRVLGAKIDPQRRQNDGPGVALLAALTLPIGQELSFASEGAVTFDVAALADFHVLGLGVGGSLGYRHRFHQRAFGGSIFRGTLNFAVGIKVPIPVLPGLVARAEIRGEFDARFSQAASRVLETDAGLTLTHGDVTFGLLAGAGLSSGVGSPAVRALFTLGWSPRDNDSDSDGINDDDDECPHLPEDFDGFQDEDGCMDPDNDNDFVPDVDDECPLEEALEDRDDDEDGCTDPIRDGDEDGIEDRLDACPDRAEDMDGVADEDGCPEDDGPEDDAAEPESPEPAAEEPSEEPAEEADAEGDATDATDAAQEGAEAVRPRVRVRPTSRD